MKKKKITHFYKKTLNKFVVTLNFSNDFIVNIKEIGKIAENIDEFYPIVPRIALMPKIGEQISFGPLFFYDNDAKTSSVQIGRNSIAFVFNEYDSWEKEMGKILKVLHEINQIINLPKLILINLTYIDYFKIPTINFDLSKYFTVPIKPTNDWDIKYHDFFLGIVPFEDQSDKEIKKVVLRLRGIGKENENYKFSLESVFIMRNLSIQIEEELFKIYLNDAHDLIETFFIEFLTQEYQEKLELIWISLPLNNND